MRNETGFFRNPLTLLACCLTLHSAAAWPADTDASWLTFNKGYDGQRYSSLKAITPQNVGTLKRVCEARLGDAGSFQSGLVVVGNTIYVTTTLSTFALDATNCAISWQYDYVPEQRVAFPANRGVAYLDGKVFRGLPDGRVIAIDAKYGRELWRVKIGDPLTGEFVSSAPIAWNGLLFVGLSGGDWGNRGRMLALSVADGHEVWRFNVIPTPGEPGAETWPDAETASHGGGAIWSSYTLDTVAEELFVPVGNPVPMDDAHVRQGDNLYTDSVVVLDARSGRLKWYYQFNRNDPNDYDLAAAPMLFSDGRGRRLVAAASKDGHLYAIDRDTHGLVYKSATTTIRAVEHEPRQAGDRICPGGMGGSEWNGPAYDPGRRAIYVGAVDWCMITFQNPASDVPGEVKFGGGIGLNFDSTAIVSGWITSFDQSSGSSKWKYHADTPVVAGITPTAGGVVFGGDIAGNLLALDADTGKLLLKYDSGGSLAGGVVTYARRGRQFVAFTSGNLSRVSFTSSTGKPKVVIMTTGLSADKPRIVTARADSDNTGGMARGQKIYSTICASCHGAAGEGGIGPALKTISSRMTDEQIKAVLESPRGAMPRFYPGTLDDKDLKALMVLLKTLGQ